VPSGATLSAGTHNADGSWTLTPAQLSGLTLTPATGYNGTLVTAITAAGNEDTPVGLHLAASLPVGATTDTLAITISGVPVGSSLSAGIYAGGGTWAVAAADLPSLILTPPANYNGTMALQLSVTSFDGAAHSISPQGRTATPISRSCRQSSSPPWQPST
jgi:hypothetical protein